MTLAIKKLFSWIIFTAILGCSQYVVQVDKQDVSKCLPFIQTGLTGRQEIFHRLGEPANTYEDGRIITYVVLDGVQERPDIIKCDKRISKGIAVYSLVLVFGPNDGLIRHSLVRVW